MVVALLSNGNEKNAFLVFGIENKKNCRISTGNQQFENGKNRKTFNF
jgi:hypothetical protein